MPSPMSPFPMPPTPFDYVYKLTQMFDLWKNNGTQQFGLFNISAQASNGTDVEREIVENVATYGRQLGRMSDVVEILLRNSNAEQWRGDDAKALDDFRSMLRDIESVKAGRLPATKANVDALIDSINVLKDVDHDEYDRIVDHMRHRILDGEKPVASAAGRTPQLASKTRSRSKSNGV